MNSIGRCLAIAKGVKQDGILLKMTLERKKFTGTIMRGDQSFPVSFDAWADGDSRLQIEIEPIPVQSLLALQSAMGEPGSFSEALVLEGTDSERSDLFL